MPHLDRQNVCDHHWLANDSDIRLSLILAPSFTTDEGTTKQGMTKMTPGAPKNVRHNPPLLQPGGIDAHRASHF